MLRCCLQNETKHLGLYHTGGCADMKYEYDVFFSCSRKYDELHYKLCDLLGQNDVVCFDWRKELQAGFNWKNQIEKAISKSEFFVILLSPELISSRYMAEELNYALQADSYGVKVIPIIITDIQENWLFDNWLNDLEIKLRLQENQIISGTIEEVSTEIVRIVNASHQMRVKYDEADTAWMYGAYERAYNAYLWIANHQSGEKKIAAYERAIHCCKKANQFQEADRLTDLIEKLKREDSDTADSKVVSEKIVWPKTTFENQDLYEKIAAYAGVTIELFEELLKNKGSAQGINCLKTSCYRLMNYCKSVGGMEDVISDILTKMQSIESDFEQNKISSDNEKIVKSYRTYLGLEVPEADNFDVFISYKSEDEMIARRVYEFLIENGKKVFFSCEVLPELGKTEYRDAIMDALDHSQHFILVTSKIDYILSNWVKEEWSCFVSKLIEDDHNGNFIMVIQDDCQIDKEMLPMNIRYKQRLMMSNFRDTLISYLQ